MDYNVEVSVGSDSENIESSEADGVQASVDINKYITGEVQERDQAEGGGERIEESDFKEGQKAEGLDRDVKDVGIAYEEDTCKISEVESNEGITGKGVISELQESDQSEGGGEESDLKEGEKVL